MARVLERIHHVKASSLSSSLSIRMWCHSDNLRSEIEAQFQLGDIQAAILRTPANNIVDLAEELAKLKFCNAVEVVYDTDGVLIYPDWP